MKSILFLERTELAPSIQQYLKLPFVQMIHSEELFKQQISEEGCLFVVHQKVLNERIVQSLNRFFMTRKGARLILFYDVLSIQTSSLFPIFPVSVLFEKRRDIRDPIQVQGQWSSPGVQQMVEIRNLSRLGALVRTAIPIQDQLGLISFVAPAMQPLGVEVKNEKRILKYWGRVRWLCNSAQECTGFKNQYGLYFVAQDA